MNILKVNDLTSLTGWSNSYIYRLTSNNMIPYYKPNGKTIFFKRAEIEDWLLRNRNTTIEEMGKKANDYVIKKGAS